MLVVADNRTARASGGQSHPGLSVDARGHDATGLNIEKIGAACGIAKIETVNLDDGDEIEVALLEMYRHSGIRMIRVLIE